MTRRFHLIRHGEVDNPDGVLYGRLPGYHLSARGVEMAHAAARTLSASGRQVDHIFASPLERTVETADSFASEFNLDVGRRPGLIEASSLLEGGRYTANLSILKHPGVWRYLVNPFRPSWGEAYSHVADRMLIELEAARQLPGSGDVVLISHQLPIWIAHRSASGRPLVHDPRKRRCGLASITSFEWTNERLQEVHYVGTPDV